MGEKFDPSGVRTRDRLVRRQPLYNRYSDANHYTIGSLVISSLDLLVTQVKLFLETTGRQIGRLKVNFTEKKRIIISKKSINMIVEITANCCGFIWSFTLLLGMAFVNQNIMGIYANSDSNDTVVKYVNILTC